VDKINALDKQPDFLLHTGDLSHLAKAAEFDTLDQLLRGLQQKQTFFVPGEHDLLGDDGKQYLERFGKGSAGQGWQSFDHKGVHFIGLNNASQLEGMGSIGDRQMAWLKNDVAKFRASTPIVVFAHIPLWAAYPDQGQRASPRSVEAIRLGDCPERAHSSGHAEGGRKRHVPLRDVNGVSATRAGKRAFRRTHEGARG
jgi:3',5'-cyclic AMP phosphodiesterase CpdA